MHLGFLVGSIQFDLILRDTTKAYFTAPKSIPALLLGINDQSHLLAINGYVLGDDTNSSRGFPDFNTLAQYLSLAVSGTTWKQLA